MSVLTETVNTPEAWSARAAAATSHERCGWSRESQRDRFEVIAAAVAAKPGDRLLDFGCGDGGLCDWLCGCINYTGYDWAAGMIDIARRHHPDRQFTTDLPTGPFDIVVVVGTFNLPGSKQATWHNLRHLWDTTGCRTLAASLYAGDDDRCLVYGEQEIENALGGLSWRSAVVRWRPNDIIAVIER